MEAEVSYRIHIEYFRKIVGVNDISLGFTHLTAAL